MSNNKDTNKIEPKFNEAQAYEELRMIFVIAIETQNFNGIEEKIAAWEKKYPLADFTNPEIIRKIKAILNKDFLSRLMGDYLAAKVLHEKEKQKKLYDDLKEIIDSARKSKDYKSAQKKITRWKGKLNAEGLSLYSFDRFYRAKVCTLLLVPSKELKNQEEAVTSLKEIKEKGESFSSDDYSKAVAEWQNKYALEGFPEKLKTELNEMTSEALGSIQEKRNEEKAVAEVREFVATNLNDMPLDSIAIVLAKYDYAHFSDEAKSQIEDLSKKASAISEQLLSSMDKYSAEDELTKSKQSTNSIQFSALNSLKTVLGKSSHDTSAILNWIYENRKVKFSQFAREEIIKQFTSVGYKIPTKGEYSIPMISSETATSQLEEIRKSAILNYLGIISQGNSLSKKGKDNISRIEENSNKSKKQETAIVLPVFNTIPSAEKEFIQAESSEEGGSTPAEKDVYNIFAEDLIADPLITCDISSPVVPENLEVKVDLKESEGQTDNSGVRTKKVEFSNGEDFLEKKENTEIDTTTEQKEASLESKVSLDDNADEEVEQPIEPILKENIELEHTEETTVEKAPKYSLTSQDQENVEKISEQTIYVAVAYPILKEALTYKVPKVYEKEHKEELENDIQKNNGF